MLDLRLTLDCAIGAGANALPVEATRAIKIIEIKRSFHVDIAKQKENQTRKKPRGETLNRQILSTMQSQRMVILEAAAFHDFLWICLHFKRS
jgi:hypothetical protein